MNLRIVFLIVLGSVCANSFAVDAIQGSDKAGVIEQVGGNYYILSALDRDGEKKSVRATLKKSIETSFWSRVINFFSPQALEFEIDGCGPVKFYRASRKGYARADYDDERSSDGDDQCLVSFVEKDLWLIK